jgi:hypothetical protein
MEDSTTRTLRRVIPGRKGLYQVTGLKDTRQRELEDQDPTFSKPFKPCGEGGRALCWFLDEVVEWQRLRAEQRDAAQAKRELKVPSIDDVAAELSKPGNLHRPRNDGGR